MGSCKKYKTKVCRYYGGSYNFYDLCKFEVICSKKDIKSNWKTGLNSWTADYKCFQQWNAVLAMTHFKSPVHYGPFLPGS